MSISPVKPAPSEISDHQVFRFLQANPGFFKAHPGLLSGLALTHESGPAVSLIERQVQVLRERNIALRRQLNNILQTARVNDDLFAKMRTLTLALLDVSAWHELNEVLATHLLVDFEADFVCCHLQREHLHLDHVLGHSSTLPTAAFIHNAQPVCATLRTSELEAVFPIQQHQENGSALMLPLALASTEGCLAVGSRDPQRFTPNLDTLFIGYIGDVLARIIDQLD